MNILHEVRLTTTAVTVDGQALQVEHSGHELLRELYRREVGDYPKFYKMDVLSAVAFVASELLLHAEGAAHEVPRTDRAVVLFTCQASCQADQAFQRTINPGDDYFPSPAAFVYTLPNIACGEIALRNGYRSETACYLLPCHDEEAERDLLALTLAAPGVQTVLGGWIDCTDKNNFEAIIRLWTN